MICYPEYASEVEREALHDYWLLADDSLTDFVYRVYEVDEAHDCIMVGTLTRNSSFLPNHPAFSCGFCKKKFPVLSRSAYLSRIKVRGDFTCAKCSKLKEQQEEDEAFKILDDYKTKHFNREYNIDSLTIEETLALLSITANRSITSDSLLYETPDDFLVTGVENIDSKILLSLARKGAVTYVHTLPPEIADANYVLYGDYGRLTYDRAYYRKHTYRHPDCVREGVYLNQPLLDVSAGLANTSTLLYQKLQSSVLSVKEVTEISNIIKDIQLDKLYRLVQEISKEYAVPIDNSTALSALLNHLAEKYSPQNIYFTFNVKVKDAIAYMRKNPAPDYIEKNYFTKFVGSYIQYVESRGGGMEKSWALPPTLSTSSFEAIFSQIYLNGHFDWNMLSANDVVALFLRNVSLLESAQNLLTEEAGTHWNSTHD